MPTWKIHLEIAQIIGKQIKYNREEMQLFMLGNILPDINNGYIIKEISTILKKDSTHYKEGKISTYMQFYKKYKTQITNPIVCGYFVHLYTDYLFNQDFYSRIKKAEIKDYSHDELRIIKQSDFQSYNDKYITNHLIIDNIKMVEAQTKLIDKVCVNSLDMENVIKFLNKQEKSNIELQFYKLEELDELMNKTIKEIKKFLSTVSILNGG